ncbi:hypothetical protein [Loktanella sp. DSM 29012]|uniref:hypothetical protein n=1 Tax=Loktanella sp. DSM 29012 TaxID=1881056 RepID=UPI00115FBA1A|nr:hypothetical protein [Loktanella sp. DSM 29012]
MLPFPASAQAEVKTAEFIPYLLEELDEVRRALDGREASQEGGWFTSGAEDYQDDLDELLDEALELIAPEEHAQWTEEVERLDMALAEVLDLQAELRLEQKGAPASEGARMVDRLVGREHPPGTVEAINRRLIETETAIQTLRAEREGAASGLAADLRAFHGIELTPDQARAALLSVHGGLMVESAVVVNTLVAVEKQLSEALEEGLSQETGRRYLGAASITRLVHSRMLARHLSTYDEVWLPRLEEMRSENLTLLAETRLQREAARLEATRATYARNVETQEHILDVIGQYESILKGRRAETVAALQRATERADAAVNTLRTLEAAAAVSGLMDQSWSEFRAVTEVEVPELLELEAEDLEQFLDISRQLSAGM